ncbi:putative Cytidylyltransferase-like [Leishmania naiffi]|uniref:Cytidylyltransferase-like n=1 Tax=Leishmania naiffi TaxID=5678 RepID=A0AAW3CCF8_9TRYP
MLSSTAAPYALRTDKLKPLEGCAASCPTSTAEAASQVTPLLQPVVLVICGSFNPIHNAHLKLYDAAKRSIEGVDGRVVLGGFLSPVSDAYGKPGLRCAADRVQVMEKALCHHPDLSVDTWECQQPTYTRTVFVLRALEEHVNAWYAQSEPAAMEWLTSHGRHVRVVFACGADLFFSFWHPGCWSLCLLRQLLDSFPLVVVQRGGARGSISDSDDFARLCQTAPLLSETAEDGERIEIDMLRYTFTFAAFSAPDDTSSTAVRNAAIELAKTPADEVMARAALQSRLRGMLPEAAVQLVVDLYGEGLPS